MPQDAVSRCWDGASLPSRYLKIEFSQFFYLQNYQDVEPDADGRRRTRGGVVMLPRKGHVLRLALDRVELDLDGDGPVQISVGRRRAGDASARIVWGEPTCPPAHHHLPTTNELFGRAMRVRDADLLTDPDVPSLLNARVVLSAGTFRELPPTHASARDIMWVMHFAHRPWARHRLTDRLDFLMPFEDQARYVLYVHRFNDASKAWDTVIAADLNGAHTLHVDNHDLPLRSPGPPPPGTYFLGEYVHLFGLMDLRAAEAVPPVGEYPQQAEAETEAGRRGVTDPICGGGQGDPDPPGDPEEPPDPPLGG